MDCMNYSFAPGMLYEEPTAYYDTDDIHAEFYKDRRYSTVFYVVWAYSYDGILDIYEEYMSEKIAKKRYDYIVENYTNTPLTEEQAKSYICLS